MWYIIYSGRKRHLLVLDLPMALAPSIYRADLAETSSAVGNVGRWGFPLVCLHIFDLQRKRCHSRLTGKTSSVVRYEPLMVPLSDLRWPEGGEMDPGVYVDPKALPIEESLRNVHALQGFLLK